MKRMEDMLKGVFAVIAAVLTYAFGGWDLIMVALASIVILDYISGLLKAAHDNKLNSKVGAKGIIKKVLYFVIVAMAHIVDTVVGTDVLLRNTCIFFFIANEGISIIENAAAMGIEMPKKLKDMLEQLREKDK